MKRQVIVFSAIAVVLGASAALIVRKVRPGMRAAIPWIWALEDPGAHPPENLTSLDLGGCRLSAPPNDPENPHRRAGYRLMVSRGAETAGIDSAELLAHFVHHVRGRSDGEEFWRLVKTYNLTVAMTLPAPDDVKIVRSSDGNLDASRVPVPGPSWWLNCDLGICVEDRSSNAGISRAVLAALDSRSVSSRHEPGAHENFLELPPEFIAGGDSSAVFLLRIHSRDGESYVFSATLEPGRLKADTPAQRVHR